MQHSHSCTENDTWQQGCSENGGSSRVEETKRAATRGPAWLTIEEPGRSHSWVCGLLAPNPSFFALHWYWRWTLCYYSFVRWLTIKHNQQGAVEGHCEAIFNSQPAGQWLEGAHFSGPHRPAPSITNFLCYLVSPSHGPAKAHILKQVFWPPSRWLLPINSRLHPPPNFSAPSRQLPWPMPSSKPPHHQRSPASQPSPPFCPCSLTVGPGGAAALCVYFFCTFRIFFYSC